MDSIALPRAQTAFDRAQKKLRKRLTIKELAQLNSVSGIDHLITKAQIIGMHLENDNQNEFREWVSKQASNLKPFERLLEGACKLAPMGGDLVWGSVGFLLEAARDKKNILKEVLDFFLSMANEMKYLQTVEAMFPDSSMVADVVEAVYVAVLEFWVKAVQYYQQKLRRGILSRMKNYVLSINMALEFSQLKEEIIAQKRTLHYMESVQHHAHEEQDRAERRVYEASEREHQQLVRQRAIVKWIDAPNYESDLRTAHQRRYGETCEWLGQNPEYFDWMERGISSFLVIYGIPGAGKTILSSWIIKQAQALRPSSRYAYHMTIYHYFKDMDSNKNTPLAAVRSFLDQIYTSLRSSNYHAFISTFERELVTQSQKQHVDFEPLWDIFSSTLTSLSKLATSVNTPLVTIVLDALDECVGSKPLVQCFRRLIHDASGLIRIVITARPSGDHVVMLEKFETNEYQPTFLRISQDDVQTDIGAFTKHKIGKIPRLQPEKHQMLRYQTIAALSDVRYNQGMFLWVYFMYKEIKHIQKPKEIRDLLDNLPPELDAMYERICQRLLQNDPRDRSLGLLVLQWVFTSKRPMQFGELEVALKSMQTHINVLRAEHLPDDDNELLWSREDVVKSCGDLVQYSHEGDTFSPVHLSAQQFFSTPRSNLSQRHPRVSCDVINPFLVDVPHTEFVIATTCLKYLLSTSPDAEKYLLPVDTNTIRTFNQDHFRQVCALLDYSVMYWADHALNRLEAWRGRAEDDDIDQLFATITELTRSPTSLIWLEEFIRLTYLEYAQNTVRRLLESFWNPGVDLKRWLKLVMNALLDFSRTLRDRPQMVRLCIQQMPLSSDDYQTKDDAIQPLEAISRGWIHYDPSTDNLFSADSLSSAPMLRCQVMKTGVRRRPLPVTSYDQHNYPRLFLCSAAISACSRFIAVMYKGSKSQNVFITCWRIDVTSETSDWATVTFRHKFSLAYHLFYHVKSSSSLAFDSDHGTLITLCGVLDPGSTEHIIQPATVFDPMDFELWLSGNGKRFVKAKREQVEVFNIDGTFVAKHEAGNRPIVKCVGYAGAKLVIATESNIVCLLVDEGKEIELPLPFDDWELSYRHGLRFTNDETKLFVYLRGAYKEGLGVLTFSEDGGVHVSLVYVGLDPFLFCLIPKTPTDSNPEVLIVDTAGSITRQSSNISWSLDVKPTDSRESGATRAVVVGSGPVIKLVSWSLFGAAHSQYAMRIQVWNLQTRQPELLSSSKTPIPNQISIRNSFVISPKGDRIFDGLHIVEAQMSPDGDIVNLGVAVLDLPGDRVPYNDQIQNYLLDGVAAYSKDGTRLAYLHYASQYASPILHVVEVAAGPRIIRRASFPIDRYHSGDFQMGEVMFSYENPDLLAIGQYVMRFEDERLVVQTEIDGNPLGFTGCGSHCYTDFSNTPKVWSLQNDVATKTSANSGFNHPTSLPLNEYYVYLPHLLGLKLSDQVVYLQRRLIDDEGAYLDRPVCVLPDRLDFPANGDDSCHLVWPDKDVDNLKLVFVSKGAPGLIDTGIKKNELMKEDQWIRRLW